jgi:UDP:flavonoid glycosyltransferase YjiC (YdhE family)
VRDELICGPADRFAADTRAEIARRRPDCVVADLLVPGVAIAAEADAIPCASLAMTLISAPGWGVPPAGPGFAPAAGPLGRLRDGLLWRLVDRLWGKGVPALNRARAVNGLDGVGSAWEQVTRPERVLILSSAAFEFAGFDPPDNVALIGPRLDDPVWAGDWAPPPGDAPLLLVALSSDQMGQAPVLRRIAAGLAGLDVRAILTTGPCVDPADVPAPPNVPRRPRAAPHAAVQRHAAAGGARMPAMGRSPRRWRTACPAVCVPLGRDQHDIAARLAHIGAGVTVRAGSRPGAFAAAVRRVIAEPSYGEAARRAAATIERERRANRVVGELEALARATVPGALAA